MALAPLSPDSRAHDCGLHAPLIRMYGADVRLRPSTLHLHRNDGFELTLLLDGAVRWEIEDGPALTLTGGDLCLMQPRVPHRGENDIIAPCTLLWMVFDPKHPDASCNVPFSSPELNRMNQSLKQQGNRVFRASDNLLRLAHCWWDIARTSKTPTAEQIPLLRSCLCGMIAMMWTETAENAPGRLSPEIQRVLSAVDAALDAPHTIPKLARLAGLSPSRFYERFRREVGLSPASYIQRQRCAMARRLLRDSKLGITEIAFRCGFSSSQYFARCFRQFTGCAPTAYRQHEKRKES